jgi:hypothetical protein
LLLIILLTSYLLSAFVHGPWIGGVELALFSVAVLLALRNLKTRRRALVRAIYAGLVLSVVILVISSSLNTDAGYGLASVWRALLLLIAIVVLIRQILIMPSVTIQSIYGAVSAYLIIGLMFAAAYSAIFYFHGRVFFANHQPGNSSTFQYFSFTTLTTLGYGDFTAGQQGGRAVAMLEAMTGQVFLATLVASLVASFTPAARSAGRDGTGDD